LGKATEALAQIISAAVTERHNCHSQMGEEAESFDRSYATLKKSVTTGSIVYVLLHSLWP